MLSFALPANSHPRLFTLWLVAILAVSSLLDLKAQTRSGGECGSEVTAAEAPLLLKQELALSKLAGLRSATHYRIPVQMHVVRHSDGSGGFDPMEFPLLFDSANFLFEQVNVEIYEYSPTLFVDNDFFYNDCSTSTQWDTLKRVAPAAEAINVYWVPDESGFGYCGVSAFPGSGSQGIIMNNACGGLSQPFNSTIVHEIGHYFNLFHTHESAFGVECPNENNCSTAGDLLCDTPADPNVYLHVSPAPACTYDNYAATPAECDATPYNPPTTNLMSYSTKACEKFFTPQQIDRFRLVVETGRAELDILAGSIAYRPKTISPMLVIPGTMADTTIRLTNIGSAPVTITYAGSPFGLVTVSGPIPQTLQPGEWQDYIVAYDASGTTGGCDVGQISDQVLFQTSDSEVPEKTIPVLVNVIYSQPAVSSNFFGSNCLHFTAPNTPGLGDRVSQALTNNLLGNVLFDASLMLGLVDGIDTVVYQDCYAQMDFAEVDGFFDSTDVFGRTLQTLRFAATDGRLYGTVTYSYGWNSVGLDSCAQITATYKVRNLCDTTLTVAIGVFADFDLDDALQNVGSYNEYTQAVYVADVMNSDRVVAIANLKTGSPVPTLHVIPNEEFVFPTQSLPDNVAYRELVGGNREVPMVTDVSALLSYGKFTLAQGGEIKIPVAFLLSDQGTWQMQGWISTLKSMLNGASSVCGDCNSSGSVSVSDVVFLLNYIFAGGPAPMPASVGDVNCSSGISISDAVYLIRYIFSGGAAPCANCP
jgi:hypothetical protein